MHALRFATIAATVLALCPAMAHLLQLPVRLGWSPELWVETTVIGGAYRMFGMIGGPLEVAAVLLSVALALVLRGREPGWGWTACGAALLVVSHALFWALVAPVNAEMAHWTMDRIPPDFAAWRAQWEYTHAARALLELGGFAALLWGCIRQLPRPGSPQRRSAWHASQPLGASDPGR
jgi:hypothetical protein